METNKFYFRANAVQVFVLKTFIIDRLVNPFSFKRDKGQKDMTVIRQPGKWNVRLFPGGAVAGPLLCMKACCFPCWGLGSLAASRMLKSIKDPCNLLLFYV